jgi:hypothetical protein
MSKFERYFYFAIILVQFAFIVFLGGKLKSRASDRVEGIANLGNVYSHLYSFVGTRPDGEKELLGFNAYSCTHYIIVTLSGNCPGCRSVIDALKDFSLERTLDIDLSVIFLSLETDDRIEIPDSFRSLKISRDDWLQFGLETPSIYLVNGQGEILLRHTGYEDGIFETMLKKALEAGKRRSKSIN